MITNLTINNFKSIKSLSIPCKRINLFIGEPNTGKSNILEALGLVSWSRDEKGISNFKEYVRLENTHDLFYDSIIDDPVSIAFDGTPKLSMQIKVNKDEFVFTRSGEVDPFTIFGGNGVCKSRTLDNKKDNILFYRFNRNGSISEGASPQLQTPSGDNLFMVAYSSKENREMLSNFFKPYGLKALFKQQDKSIEIIKQVDDILVSYPYSMTSDTLRSIIFYLLAIKSNKDSTLVFEEPEAHAFPYYTKHLGEIIAKDESNQYFIATHNPYLLNAIVEKAPAENVKVCITYYRDYQTKVKQLSSEELSQLLDEDPFLGLDHYIGEK